MPRVSAPREPSMPSCRCLLKTCARTRSFETSCGWVWGGWAASPAEQKAGRALPLRTAEQPRRAGLHICSNVPLRAAVNMRVVPHPHRFWKLTCGRGSRKWSSRLRWSSRSGTPPPEQRKPSVRRQRCVAIGAAAVQRVRQGGRGARLGCMPCHAMPCHARCCCFITLFHSQFWCPFRAPGRG